LYMVGCREGKHASRSSIENKMRTIAPSIHDWQYNAELNPSDDSDLCPLISKKSWATDARDPEFWLALQGLMRVGCGPGKSGFRRGDKSATRHPR
jgi:hypothetical protein